ncbi:MAG: PAS domain-containing protein, partial [Methylotenera sp.]
MANPLEGLSFQNLFDAAADAMLLANDLGQIVEANEVALQLLGYNKAQMLDLKIEALMPERFGKQHQHNREAYSKKPEKRSLGKGRELLALRSDGSEIALDISLSPIQANSHRFTLVTFHLADQRRQVEEALKISEER